MSIGIIVVIVLIVFLLGGFHPSLGYSNGIGGIGLGTVLIIVLILVLLGKL